jgi:hypothetical protein
MTTFFLICAVAGGTIFVVQLLLMILGGHGLGDLSHDIHAGDSDHDAAFWGIFSVRALVAGVTAFGIGGLAAKSAGAVPVVSFATAAVAALAAATLVAVLLGAISRLADDGTAHIERAVGSTGVVYLNIPAEKSGLGKVTLQLQNRSVELDAMTYGNKLETGTRVVVTSVIGPGAVEVIAVPQMASQYVSPRQG